MDAVAQDEIDAIQAILSRLFATLANPLAVDDSAFPDEEDNPPLTRAAQDKITRPSPSSGQFEFRDFPRRSGLAPRPEPQLFRQAFYEYTGMNMNDFITDLRFARRRDSSGIWGSRYRYCLCGGSMDSGHSTAHFSVRRHDVAGISCQGLAVGSGSVTFQ